MVLIVISDLPALISEPSDRAGYIANLMSGANDTAFKGVSDPRVWYMLSENANGTFKGVAPWLGVTEYLSGTTPTKIIQRIFGDILHKIQLQEQMTAPGMYMETQAPGQ